MFNFTVYMDVDVGLDLVQIRTSNGEKRERSRANPAGNPSRFRPDSDVVDTIHVRLRFSFLRFSISDSFKRVLMFRNVLDCI